MLIKENLIIESKEISFYIPEVKESAYKNGHIYWGDLLPIVKSHPKNQFILIHFSTRYTDEFITEFFDNTIKENELTNVYPWLN